MTSRSLYSGDDTDMSTTRGYYANDLIRETWVLERHRGGMARGGFGGREPALDLEKQAGIRWVTKGVWMSQGEEAAWTELCEQDMFKDTERGRRRQEGLLREVWALSAG